MQKMERRDRWVSAGLTVLLHGAIIGALIYGWWSFRHPAPSTPPTLAIDATVVSSKSVPAGRAGAPKPQHAPEPQPPLQTVTPTVRPVEPPPLQTTPPPPVADDQTGPPPPAPKPVDHTAEQKAKQQAEQKAEAQAKQKAEEQNAQQEAQERAAEQAAQRKAKEAQAKKRAEQQRLAEAKRKEEERKAEQQRKLEAARKAEEERRATEAKALAQNQAELSQDVSADEQALAVRTGPAMATYKQLIEARIQRAWIKPPSARQGVDCFIDITQVPGGEVTNVKVGACNGDEAVRQSIQDAAYRASPLPQPSDPALFAREIRVEFKPTE